MKAISEFFHKPLLGGAYTAVVDRRSEMLSSEFQGYLAVPEGGKGSGVLVLHPWWGLNDTIKKVCDRLAGEGFIACAPDLYHGQIAVTIKETELLSSKLDSEQAKTDIAEAVNLLGERTKPEGQGLG
jgi:carboxymethylenebutenolidase